MPDDEKIKEAEDESQVPTENQAAQAEDELPDIPPEPTGDDDWTEEDMRLLSDEERAALFDDGEESEEGGGEPDEADEGDDKGEAAAQEASDDAAPDDADDDDGIRGTQTPDLSALDQELEALETAKVEAFDKWEEGDLSRDEYLEKIKEIDGATKDAVSRRAIAASQEQAVYTAFIETARDYFKDHPDLATDEHAEAYDRHVRSVTASPQYQHMSHRQMLAAAHRLYIAEGEALGVEVPGLPSAKADPAPKPQAEVKSDTPPPPKKRPGDKAPKTLANMPSAAPVSVSDGKYSSLAQRLENASAEEYERIMGSLSPDEAEAFASMDV